MRIAQLFQCIVACSVLIFCVLFAFHLQAICVSLSLNVHIIRIRFTYKLHLIVVYGTTWICMKRPGENCRASISFYADLFLSQGDRIPKIRKIKDKSRFYYINGLQDLLGQIDMVLTFHFRPGIPRKCIYKSPENHPRVFQKIIPNSGMIFQAFIKTFLWKPLTKMKGKDHIYLDK